MLTIGDIDPGAALAAFMGPLTAVGITLWLQQRDASRQRKETLLRQLLLSRINPADPTLGIAVTLIPVEFRHHPRVRSAHKDFLAEARKENNGERIGLTLDTLTLEIMKVLGFDVEKSRDVVREPYSSLGFGNAMKTQSEALLALPRLAAALERTAAASEATRDLLTAATASASQPREDK